MGLIINPSIQKMIKGFPTVSDKYNVAGGLLSGSYAVNFGDLVAYSSTTGYYTTAAGASAITDIAGFVLGTNVKLSEGFATNVVQVNVGEAFNLLLNGYIAVELDSGATASYITPNAQMCVILSTGKVTTSDNYNASTAPYLPNAKFTGEYENQGTAAAPKYVAEVCIN